MEAFVDEGILGDGTVVIHFKECSYRGKEQGVDADTSEDGAVQIHVRWLNYIKYQPTAVLK
jgi:hypothetical protein